MTDLPIFMVVALSIVICITGAIEERKLKNLRKKLDNWYCAAQTFRDGNSIRVIVKHFYAKDENEAADIADKIFYEESKTTYGIRSDLSIKKIYF